MATNKIDITITGDTHAFRRTLLATQLALEQRSWRRLMLRFQLWRQR